MAKTKQQLNREYYEKHHKKIIQKAAERSRKAKANKTFAILLNELAGSRIKLEAQLLHGSMKGWQINPDHLVLLWKEYTANHDVFLTMDNVSEHRPDFERWVEKRLAPKDGE
ncbi:conserved hypothetical protein [Vibrio crassostreae]|nr:conserved hypothetical protein [Vibrio crassostreae]CAK2767382.1 conserved hypothetical protein [Vibrio crassostreae]CAK2769690.1 conserved hypothetical protein [Vibrio crassostreae]CAK2775257.1 conserved hypothetical protein [Vibrio crassostreae]CAK2778033.1 conserved hypothetical protein [Vibrio crassostreae]